MENPRPPLPAPHRRVRSAEEARVLLEAASRQAVRLTVTHNRSRFVSFAYAGNLCRLRINEEFLAADEATLRALADWIAHPKRGCPAEIRGFISSCPRPAPTPRPRKLLARGRFHDLAELAQQVNDAFFAGQVASAITWSRVSPRRRVRVRRLGAYLRHADVITISPILDRPETPSRFLAYVIYHEMLHALQPPNHPRPHDSDFRAALRRHPDHDWALRWEKANMRLLCEELPRS